LAGNSIRNSPRWSVNSALEYTQPINNGGAVVLRADADFKSTVYFDQYNTNILKQGDLALLNAQGTYRFPDGKWSVALAGKNLTNRLYYTGGVAFAGLNYTPQAYVGDPRTYWIQASYTY
jgi:iron complex outermembrane recepter protein